MNFNYHDGRIIACSTGSRENTAISIIRISGFDKLSEFSNFFSLNLNKVEARRAYYTDLFDHTKKVLDSIVLLFFKAPYSYNGENILELHVHGNLINIDRIIKLFLSDGFCRLASPGEFTYRALKNNKMSLSQVEGLDAFLNANSSFSLDQGLSLVSGELNQSYLNLRETYIKLKSSVELLIDFSDDVGEESGKSEIKKHSDNFKRIINKLLARTQTESSGLLNPEIVLFGQTNAGKSSFFNACLDQERAIVSNIEGTTRDYVSERLSLDGVSFSIIDTAGIRNTSSDEIEKIGIQRSLDLLENCFFSVLLINPFLEFKSKDYISKVDLVVFTHCDQDGFWEEVSEILKSYKIKDFVFSGPIEPSETGPIGPRKNGPIEPSKTGPIGPNLSYISPRNVLQPAVDKYLNLLKNDPIMIKRHQLLIELIGRDFVKFQSLMDSFFDIAIISSELNLIGQRVEELIGVVSPDDVLNNIFENFCIGK